MTTQNNINAQLAALAGELYHDPLEFVMRSYPWAHDKAIQKVKMRPLMQKRFGVEYGPEQWQIEVLEEWGEHIRNVKFNGVDAVSPFRCAVVSGHGVGKGSNFNDLLPTPNAGLKKAKDIKAGDYLFGEDGSRVKVRATKKWKNIPFYRVKFNDNSSVDVSSGHLWKVKGRQQRRNNLGWIVMETEEIVRKGVLRSNGKNMCRQWEIPIQGAVDYPKRNHPIDPYLYAVWLGDGDKTGSSLAITNPDMDVWHNIKEEYSPEHSGRTRPSGRSYHRTVYGMKREMVEAGLWGCTTYTASVRRDYIESADRLSVLQGLLDCEGWVEASGGVGFCSTSGQLTRDVVEIARSLGLMAREPHFHKNDYAGYWRTHITWDGKTQLFRVRRKMNRLKKAEGRYQKRFITAIEPIENSNCICFEVEGGLYLTRDYHVTHNSTLTSWIIQFIMATRPYSMGRVTATTFTQAKVSTWARLAFWHQRFVFKNWFIMTSSSQLQYYHKDFGETWRVDGIPSDENRSEAFQGQHAAGATSFYINDEGSGIPDIIYEVQAGGLVTGEPAQFIFSNPTKNTGYLRDIYRRHARGGAKQWKLWQINSEKVKITNKEFIKTVEEEYGRDSNQFRIRVLGEFPSQSSRQLIPESLIEAAQNKHLLDEDYKDMPVILSCDPAWEGDDELVISMRQGLFFQVLYTEEKSPNHIRVAQRLERYQREYKAKNVFIDQGWGVGIHSYGVEKGLVGWRMVSFAEKPINPQAYVNKRAEMYDKILKWLQDGGVLPNDYKLYQDLASVETVPRPDGKLQIESKNDMKKRNLKSPDRGDSLALTLADRVGFESESTREYLIEPDICDGMDYNPLENF